MSVAVDGNTNVHVAAAFSGTVNLGSGTNTQQFTSLGSQDMLVSKFDSEGNFLSARTVGGPNYNLASAIAVDDSGREHLVGFVNAINNAAGNVYMDGFADRSFDAPVTVRVD